MNQDAALQIDLRQMILAIETAVSLVGMNDTNHGKRVGYIASQLGHELGFSDPDLQFSFELGMLHDCGVSTEQMHSNLVNHFDWEDAHIHCEIGYQLLKNFEPLKRFAVPILHHHTRWDELKSTDISMQDARMANLIFLSDRIDVLGAVHYSTDILIVRQQIVDSILSCRDSYFNPVFVDAFVELQKHEAFWITMEDRHITRFVWDMGQFHSDRMLTLKQIKQLSMIMSYIVDQKSAFTAEHSVRVADLSRYLANSYGLNEVQCEKVEIAGLLHDLGKLHTPDHILEKPGPLNKMERATMNQHSFETYEILRQIKGLGEVALWAAYHHEGLNGGGYPFHPREKDMPIEARIIAVADIFQALVQDRPYRKGMVLDKVLRILNKWSDSGKLDASVVELVNSHAQDCFEIAQGSLSGNKTYIELFRDGSLID